MASPPEVAFIHIPKTGGNSVLNALKSLYDQNDISPFIYEVRANVENWPKYKLVAGHMGFSFAQRFGLHMITVVRDPVERTVSLYNFWRSGRTPMREVLKDMTFEDFLKSEHRTIVVNRDNTQTWQLAHSLVRGKQRRSALSGDALLGQALKNLEKISIVGVTERLDEFASRFQKTFNVELPALAYANKTRKRPKVEDLSAEAQDLIRQRTALDRVLHQHVSSVA